MVYRRTYQLLKSVNLSISHIPVNVLPKTSSSGGSSSFGVVVFVIDNFDRSMPCNVAVDPEPTSELYVRLHCQFSGSFEGSSLLADEKIDPASNRLDWWSMLSDQWTIASLCFLTKAVGGMVEVYRSPKF